MVGPTRAEPGCLGYDLYQSVEDPSVMFLYENWTDQAKLDKHRRLCLRMLGRHFAPGQAA